MRKVKSTNFNTDTPAAAVHAVTCFQVLNSTLLRAIDNKYEESNDRSENSDFLLLRQKEPFGELFSEIYLKSSSELTFF